MHRNIFYLSYNCTGADVPRALRQLQSKWLILGDLADDPVSALRKKLTNGYSELFILQEYKQVHI